MSFKRFTHLGARWHIEPQLDDVRGFQVFDSAGKFIGIVDDLLVDTDQDNKISYALIGQGNVATMLSGKELIVPFSKLNLDSGKKTLRLDATLDQLWDFPTYHTLEDPDLKAEIDEFWASTALARPIVHDVTLPHPASLESPMPIPDKVAPSKMPAGNPRIVAGLDSPVPQSIIDRALSKMAEREAKAAEKPVTEIPRPEAEEKRPEKPAA